MKIFTFFLSASTKSGDLRRDEGDIIDIKEGIWQLGLKERKHFFAVLLEFEDTCTIDKLQILASPKISGETIVAKRKYKISLDDVKTKAQAKSITVELNKVRDENQDYQILLDGETSLSMKAEVYDKDLARKLTEQELNTLLGL